MKDADMLFLSVTSLTCVIGITTGVSYYYAEEITLKTIGEMRPKWNL